MAWKARPTQTPARTRDCSRPVMIGGRRGVRRQHQQQDEQRVRDVAAVQQDGDRRRRQREGGDEAGAGARHPAHGAVEDEDGQGPLDHLGQHDGPDVEAEEAYRERLEPERPRQLVDRDRAPGVEGTEEEVVPVPRHAAHRGAVEGLERGAADAPAVGECRERGDHEERRSRPPGLVRGRAPELPAAGPHDRSGPGRRLVARLRGRIQHEAPDHVPHPGQPSPRRGESGCQRVAPEGRQPVATLRQCGSVLDSGGPAARTGVAPRGAVSAYGEGTE